MEKKNTDILRIALIGPESTSKSTLSENLAKHFKTVWVPEYSRIYLEGLNHKYNLNDVLIIAQEQFRQEQRLLKNAQLRLAQACIESVDFQHPRQLQKPLFRPVPLKKLHNLS